METHCANAPSVLWMWRHTELLWELFRLSAEWSSCCINISDRVRGSITVAEYGNLLPVTEISWPSKIFIRFSFNSLVQGCNQKNVCPAVGFWLFSFDFGLVFMRFWAFITRTDSFWGFEPGKPPLNTPMVWVFQLMPSLNRCQFVWKADWMVVKVTEMFTSCLKA